jgi:hypothetical protein
VRRGFAAGALAALLAGVPVLADGERAPAIADLATEWRSEVLWVGYRVADGLTAEARERIQSGLPFALEHRLEIVTRRPLPLWPARVHARAVVTSRVSYDALTGRYDVVRTIERRRRGSEPTEEEERLTTSSEIEMQEFMTRVPPLALYEAETVAPSRPLRVRVESDLGRRFLLLLFPARLSVTAERTLGG